MIIGTPSYTKATAPTKSVYGNYLQIDNVFDSIVPVSELSSGYNHKLSSYIAATQFTFPNLSGYTDDPRIPTNITGHFDNAWDITYSDVVNEFYTSAKFQEFYDALIDRCEINGDDAKIDFNQLLSGVHAPFRDDNQIYMAFARRGSSDIYTIAAYGKFDLSGNPIIPSAKINTVYRRLDSVIDWNEYEEGDWELINRRVSPHLYANQGNTTMAQNDSLTGFVYVGSPRRMPYQVLREGNYYQSNKTPASIPAQYLNAYRNSETGLSGFNDINWNGNVIYGSYYWSYLLCNMNISSSVYWKFNSQQPWFNHPDKVLNYEGEHDWTIEAAHFGNGNVNALLDFRTGEEIENSFLGAQIDIFDLMSYVGYSNQQIYGKAVFRNGEFYSGAWYVYGTQTSGLIE